MTERGVFHPMLLNFDGAGTRLKPPCMVEDGETLTFHFDLLSFEGEWLPKAVWVQDAADRRYTKRVSRKQQRHIREMVALVRKRVGPDVESQRDAMPESELDPMESD